MSFGAIVFGDLILGTFESGSVTPVERELGINWTAVRVVTQSKSYAYSIFNEGKKDININYSIDAYVSAPLDIRWDIKTGVVKEVEILWTITTPLKPTVTGNSFCPPVENRIKSFCI